MSWLLGQCDRPDKRVLMISEDAGRYVPFFVHDGQIDFDFGEMTLASRRVRRHVLVGNFSTLSAQDWIAVLDCLSRSLQANATVFLLGVVAGEPLDKVLREPAIASRFLVLQHGPSYERRICRIGSSLDAYLSALPSGRRQDLRRSLRRFEREFDDRWDVRVYTREDEIAAMLDEVEPVSGRTYQARLRGLSLSRRNYTGREALEGARRGFARCYLLTVNGRPVAWRIGFLYGGVYCSHHVGYDPDFEKWHAGVVMHLKSVEDLAALGSVSFLDMLYGDNDFKRKAANLSRNEANYYLFPRTIRGRISHALLASCNRISALVGDLLQRSGLKASVKRWLRRP